MRVSVFFFKGRRCWHVLLNPLTQVGLAEGPETQISVVKYS